MGHETPQSLLNAANNVSERVEQLSSIVKEFPEVQRQLRTIVRLYGSSETNEDNCSKLWTVELAYRLRRNSSG
jgi:hypothetical protein